MMTHDLKSVDASLEMRLTLDMQEINPLWGRGIKKE